MDGLLELGGMWLARAYAFYGIFFLGIPFITFGGVALPRGCRLGGGLSRP